MAYYKDTSPLIGYYYAKQQLQQVNGLNSIEEVGEDISEAISSI
jgi:adenylate kinase